MEGFVMFAVVRHRSPKLGRSVPHSYLFQAITTIELSGIATRCRPCPARIGANVYGLSSDTNTIRIGLPYDGTNGQNQTFIAGIYGTPITNGLPVVINANGQLGIAALPVSFQGPPGGSGTQPPAMVAQLQQQVRDQQTTIANQGATIADQGARLARLED